MRISNYGCTWEVWRTLKKLEFFSAIASIEQLLRFFRALQTSRVHTLTISMNQLFISARCCTYRNKYLVLYRAANNRNSFEWEVFDGGKETLVYIKHQFTFR